MVTDTTRNDVWQQMLDAARLVRYYERIADRYRQRHFRLRMALLVLALGGASTTAAVLPDYTLLGVAQAAASLAFIVLVALDVLGGHAKKAAVLDSIRRECVELETELRSLWSEIETGELLDKEARRRYLDLERQVNRVTDRPEAQTS